jgi:hypothetical protein
MTKDDIIRIAREAGGFIGCAEYAFVQKDLERFAALVAAHEREECAKVVDQEVERVKPLYSVVAENAAKAIRARNNP